MKIAIIGYGFVGKAVSYGFSDTRLKQTLIDPILGLSLADVNIHTHGCIFVCLPTPMGDDGSIDSSILDSVLNEVLNIRGYKGLVIIKSTVTPDIIRKYENYKVVYNPEFLTEKKAEEQFVNPDFHVFGGRKAYTNFVEQLYKKYSLCAPCPVFHTSLSEASIIKYAVNSYLAVKVTFFNQLYDLCEKENDASFNTIVNAVITDPRIGSSHTRVPGFDRKRGFGGSCFPKDTSAISNYTDTLSLVEAVIKINNTYREGYDLDDREKEQSIRFSSK